MGDSCFGQDFQGGIVIDFIFEDNAAMTVRGIFTEADVSKDEEFRYPVLNSRIAL